MLMSCHPLISHDNVLQCCRCRGCGHLPLLIHLLGNGLHCRWPCCAASTSSSVLWLARDTAATRLWMLQQVQHISDVCSSGVAVPACSAPKGCSSDDCCRKIKTCIHYSANCSEHMQSCGFEQRRCLNEICCTCLSLMRTWAAVRSTLVQP